MKVYVYTMINNEQRYIDDWLKYQFIIGVDKVILYEDYMSDHHDVMQYGDKVEIRRIPKCFNNIETELLKQHVYRQNIVYQHFNRAYRDDCDWFFLTDVDEYLEVDNIKQFIDRYKYFDQILVTYKMYGWSGHIYDPYPGRPYYTRATYDQVVDTDTSILALAYPYKAILKSESANIPRFQHECEVIPHLFAKRKTVTMHNRLAHYWTRSLEEYICRLATCGVMRKADWNRTIDDFFIINNLNREDYEFYIKEFTDKYGNETKINDDF